ncbi:MAG: polysaccharide deacetylase family protein [Planctomycetes bacterium]|nr:polysaccharide deacetylase family protein [Planctomycetota bacterium]
MITRLQKNARFARIANRIPILRNFVGSKLFEGVSWPGEKTAAMVISFDVDYAEDEAMMPELMESLRKFGFRASVACIGKWMEIRPAAYEFLRADDVEIVNHSYSHPNHDLIDDTRKFSSISRAEMIDEVKRCHEIAVQVAGKPPDVFRAPHFLWTREMFEALKDAGYLFSSSGFYSEEAPAFSLPRIVDGVLEIPLYRRCGTYHTLRKGGTDETGWLALVRSALDIELSRGGVAVFYFDPMDFSGRLTLFEEFLSGVDKDRLWVTTLGGLCRHLST